MFSLKKVQKSFNKTIQRASDFLSTVGPSPIKSFRAALLSGDEEKALVLYQTESSNGSSLENDLPVSLPFPLKAYEDQTPMHLAALKAMEMLITIFLQRNGNPNALNANAENCLHSLCQEPDQDSKRRRIMNILLQWRGLNEYGGEEYVSVNRVDNDGNSPLHYASKNGLIECILLLTTHNAIISIVNKDQMTCCEIAAANEHHQLADMLEIALIFPPPDQDVILYDDDERRYSQQMSVTQPIFLCDTATYTFRTLDRWRLNGIDCAVAALGLPRTYTERVLDHFNWELERALEEMLIRKDEVLDLLNLNLSSYKPVIYVSKKQRSVDAADLDDIFVDIGDQQSVILKSDQSSQTVVVHIDDYESSVGTCAICGEDIFPTLSPQVLLNKELPHCEQREIRCPSGHSYCCTCWAHHWTVQINDNSATFLNCMAFKCGEILSADEWAFPVLGSSLADKLKSNLLRRIVDVSPRWRWCPAKDCDSIICISSTGTPGEVPGLKAPDGNSQQPPQQLPQTAICGNGHAICLTCNGDAHAPCGCDHWKSWVEKVQREIAETEGQQSQTGIVDVASALWVAANTKKCPRCHTPIEKNEGCNHMTCRKCRYEFCWICFQDWEKHSNRTGGYFQCTIYAGNNPPEVNIGRDDEVPRIDLDDDYGSAAKEASRARERAQIMDRFIHHYTRFRAHSDSLALEQNMHATNLHRIRSSLHSSAIGTIPWLQGPSAPHPYLAETGLKSSGGNYESSSEDLLCPGEALDISLMSGGDWSQEVESPLLFLQRGFRELIKCRQVLRGSYPMAFYMMTDETPTYRWRHYDYEVAQRKAYAESRSKVFLEMQSDLEILTETLSDVVARRRLRASANQISRATFLARSRRLEFEAVIKRHYEAYEQDKLAESKESQSRSNRSSRRSAPRFMRHEVDDDEGLDPHIFTIMESLRDTGLADDIDPYDISSPRIRNALMRHTLTPQSRSSRSGVTRRTPEWRRSTRRRHESEDDVTVQPPPEPELTPSATESNVTTPQQPSMREILMNAGWTEEDLRREGIEGIDEIPNQQSVSPPAATQSSRTPANQPPVPVELFPGEEDEEEINRAILMSLQERQPSYANTERPEPPEEIVQLLIGMGFSRDSSIQALKDYGENVEDAIMYLASRA